MSRAEPIRREKSHVSDGGFGVLFLLGLIENYENVDFSKQRRWR